MKQGNEKGGILQDKIKKKLKIKIALAAAAVLGPYILLVSCMTLFLPVGTAGDEVGTVKQFDIPHDFLTKAYAEYKENNIEFAYLLTLAASEAHYNPDAFDDSVLDKAIERALGHGRWEMDAGEKDIYNIYSKYYNDLMAGPIAEGKKIIRKVQVPEQGTPDPDNGGTSSLGNQDDANETKLAVTSTVTKTETTYYKYSSIDDFGDPRDYGGERLHQGNDLIADKEVPVISMTDGIVSNLGWDEFGGNRVGISTDKGTYFYYAHLSAFEEGLSEGEHVKAGDIIGYVGDTDYGPPGTSGKFISHLHVQIGVKMEDMEDYLWVNPYNIVKSLDPYRIMLTERRDDS